MAKKIIDGKKYDTETAECIGSYENIANQSDFNYFREFLYRKRTGEFFLYGKGGPMSRYSKEVGNNEWGWGEKITPISEEEAKEWAENHLSADEYEAVFGPVEE